MCVVVKNDESMEERAVRVGGEKKATKKYTQSDRTRTHVIH